MNIRITIVVVFSLFIILLVGCKKDEIDTFNSINYEGNEYPVSKATLQYLDSVPNEYVYRYQLNVLSDGFTITESGDSISSISGTGNVIIFEFYLSKQIDLFPADYYLHTVFNDTMSYRIKNSIVGLNHNIATGVGTNVIIASGEVNISKITNNEISLAFDLIGANEKAITGNFSGQLTRYGY